MNTLSASRPRLLCRVVRGWSAIAGDPATGATARHVTHCAACQEFFAAAAVLDTRLRAAAPHRARPLPEGFEQRMARALAPLTRERPAAESGSRTVLWSFFGSAAAAAVVAFLLLRPADESRTGPALLVDNQLETPVRGAGRSSNERIIQAITEDPLQQEIDSVYSDARAALRFLALNFLPASAVLPPDDAGSTSS